MKKLGYLILLMFASLMLPLRAHAEEVTQDIGYVSQQSDMIFEVYWDAEQPEITFISPSGQEYDPLDKSKQDTTSTVVTKASLHFLVCNAEVGQWKVKCDALSNKNVTFKMKEQKTNLIIRQFDVGSVTNDSITAQFLVEDSDHIYYDYKLSAVADKSGDELVLEEGNAAANTLVERTLSLNQLNSCDHYMIKLYVSCQKDRRDLFDFVYSEPFSYTNSNTLQSEVDYSVVINKANYSVTITYPDLPWGAEHALVAMFVDDAEEPAQYDKYQSSANSVNYMYDASAKKLRFEFSYQMNGRYTAPVVKTADLSTSPELTFPAEETSNVTSINVSYTNCDGKLASIFINDAETPKQLKLTGDGNFNLAVEEDWNKIVISYPETDTLSYEFRYDLFINRRAPKLTMYEDYTNVKTKDSEYTIMGMASDFETLTIGDTTVTPEKNGEFTYKVQVKDGINVFPIVATNAVGSETIYTAKIIKGDDINVNNIKNDNSNGSSTTSTNDSVEAMSQDAQSSKSGYVIQDFILLIGSFVVALVIIILALKFWKKPSNPSNHTKERGEQ